MPTDYDQIREDNIRGYGEKTVILDLLARELYTDRTHFVFELLQNAEDADATTVSFALFPDRLEMRHNGRLFNGDDVRGVCGVGEGTKSGDLTRIGKFGIGFKSVYSYTATPEIHSGDEHFHIAHYVRPFAATPREPGARFTTLFIFPFDRDDVPAARAFTQIADRLAQLDVRTMLFLRNVRDITWEVTGGASGIYLRDVQDVTRIPCARRVHVLGELGQATREETWLVFDRAIAQPDSEKTVRVEAAFLLAVDDETGREGIVRAADTNLVVFFPTQKETHLGFLIQGPYRTTPARDNVPQDNDWNRQLIDETASLVVETLPRLRDGNLLTVGLLQALPIRSGDFPQQGMFYRIFARVRDALAHYNLLPTGDGRFSTAAHVKLARGAGLRELLAEPQLTRLFDGEDPVRWLPDEITQDRAPELRAYLREELEVDEVTPEIFASRFDEDFIAAQTDAWVGDFYAFLTGQRALWRPGGTSWNAVGSLRHKPIIRLRDGRHVAPFRSDGLPTAYLPIDEDVDYPTIKPEVLTQDQAWEFLKSLGLTAPDIVAEVLERVLPRYNNPELEPVSATQHARDIQKIVSALQTDARGKIVDKLRETAFVLAEQSTTGERAYQKPGQVYVRTPELVAYFCGKEAAWFLAEDEALATGLSGLPWSALGIERRPRFRRREAALNVETKVALRNGQGCTRDVGSVDYYLDGLKSLLLSLEDLPPTEARARALLLWNYLLDYLDNNPSWNRREYFEGVYRWFYSRERSVSFPAMWITVQSLFAWLPTLDGHLHEPESISLSDLPPEFRRETELAAILGMRSSTLETLALEANIPVHLLEYVRNNPQKVAAFMAEEERRLNAPKAEELARVEVGQFASSLEDAFDQPGETNTAEDGSVSGPVSNPTRRREKTNREIAANQNSEPLVMERFSRVPRKVWEGKDSDVRVFLQEEYRGRCQICRQTFAKRDGTPYFEGLYLVPRAQARWIDREGNVLSLCATCCAKMQFGAVDAHDILDQILAFRAAKEAGDGDPALRVTLCGDAATIHFTERHMLDLQEMVKASLPEPVAEVATVDA